MSQFGDEIVSIVEFENRLASKLLTPNLKIKIGEDTVTEPLKYIFGWWEIDLLPSVLEAFQAFQKPLHEKFQQSVDDHLLEASEKGYLEGKLGQSLRLHIYLHM